MIHASFDPEGQKMKPDVLYSEEFATQEFFVYFRDHVTSSFFIVIYSFTIEILTGFTIIKNSPAAHGGRPLPMGWVY